MTEPDRRSFVGHYGCSSSSRLVRVLPVRGVQKPHWSESYKIECPSCGDTHVVRPTWRRSTQEERTQAEKRLVASERV